MDECAYIYIYVIRGYVTFKYLFLIQFYSPNLEKKTEKNRCDFCIEGHCHANLFLRRNLY